MIPNINDMLSCRNTLSLDALTALYCRLSVDDSNDGDSNSIQHHDVIYKGWITPPKITS